MSYENVHPDLNYWVKNKNVRDRYRWIETALRKNERLPTKTYLKHHEVTEALLSKDLVNYHAILIRLGGEAKKKRSKITVHKWPELGFAGSFSAIEWHMLTCPDGVVEVAHRPLALEAEEITNCIVRCIREKTAVEIGYHSTTSGERPATISPHTLVVANGRTHVRAYDHKKHDYRDFVIARMGYARSAPHNPYVDSSLDADWIEKDLLQISIKAQLPQSQREAIAKSIGLNQAHDTLNITCRRALVRYEISALGIPIEGEESYFEYSISGS